MAGSVAAYKWTWYWRGRTNRWAWLDFLKPQSLPSVIHFLRGSHIQSNKPYLLTVLLSMRLWRAIFINTIPRQFMWRQLSWSFGFKEINVYHLKWGKQGSKQAWYPELEAKSWGLTYQNTNSRQRERKLEIMRVLSFSESQQWYFLQHDHSS